MQKKPKDYQLAEAGYNAFYNEQPQVWFDDLGHDYKMKWVRAARAMMGHSRRLTYRSTPEGHEVITEKPKKKGPLKGKVLGPRIDYEALNEIDTKFFTDKPWKDKTEAEMKARARVSYRRQAAKRQAKGEPTKHQRSERYLNGS